jgi:hypothetical protein
VFNPKSFSPTSFSPGFFETSQGESFWASEFWAAGFWANQFWHTVVTTAPDGVITQEVIFAALQVYQKLCPEILLKELCLKATMINQVTTVSTESPPTVIKAAFELNEKVRANSPLITREIISASIVDVERIITGLIEEIL